MIWFVQVYNQRPGLDKDTTKRLPMLHLSAMHPDIVICNAKEQNINQRTQHNFIHNQIIIMLLYNSAVL